MNIIRNIEEFQKYRKNITKSIGFIPTMGALHEGHLSLIKKAKLQNDFVIVSIFINPTQFLKNEDINTYPKKEEADLHICKLAGVNIVFIPKAQDIYTKDELCITAPKIRGFIFEGLKRSGHFDGVLIVVLKLFNLVKPTNAYFGKKDAQQLILIIQMVQNLFLDIKIVPCNTIREKNGLALSSRNTYLNKEEKTRALSISRSMYKAIELIKNDTKSTKKIIKKMQKHLLELDVEYVAIVDYNLHTIENIEINNSIILVAAKVGTTRLIDNMWI